MNKRHNWGLSTCFFSKGDEKLYEIKVAYILSNLPRESEHYDLNGNSDSKKYISGATLAA